MMRRPWLVNLVLLLAIAAAGVRLAAIWRSPLPELPGAGVSAGTTDEAGGAGDAPGAAPPADGAEGGTALGEAYDVIAAKDVFSQARGVAPPKAAAAPAAKAVTPPKPPPKITLFGVVIVDGEKSAFLLEGAGDGKPRKVREGESFAGGTLRSIRPDGVTLALPTGEVSVALRTPKEGAAGAVMPNLPNAGGVPGTPRTAPLNRRFPQGAGARSQAAIPVPGRPSQAPRFTPAPQAGVDADEEFLDEDLDEDLDDEEYLDDEDFEDGEFDDEEYLDDEEEY